MNQFLLIIELFVCFVISYFMGRYSVNERKDDFEAIKKLTRKKISTKPYKPDYEEMKKSKLEKQVDDKMSETLKNL